MELGLFLMPSHPPERSLSDGARWDLEVLRRADALGYTEAWIGEHFTVSWEPCPAPDLLISRALAETQRIRLAPGAHILPYHHPAELAHRVAYLDHLSQGRLMLGVGASGIPSDWSMFCVDGMAGVNRKMMWESLDIMLKLWTAEEPFTFKGDYWTVSRPEPMLGGLMAPHIRPYQEPHPPIGIAALTPKSDSLRICGQRGYMPLSLNLSDDYVAGHWEAISAGAAEAGRPADRSLWRVTRDVFVADTDEEAYRWCADGTMLRMMREYFIPVVQSFGMVSLLKHDPDVPDDEVTAEYLMRHCWLVGSVDTVVARLQQLVETTGGFGTLLQLGYDYSEHPEPWFRSMELMATEVMPRVAHL
jgi:alkanesulfonate monooxygenase SsuD/methylene tetrahydromethanopterin reductase-like flavin-dependent oxidoreductase (luciferase family)